MNTQEVPRDSNVFETLMCINLKLQLSGFSTADSSCALLHLIIPKDSKDVSTELHQFHPIPILQSLYRKRLLQLCRCESIDVSETAGPSL